MDQFGDNLYNIYGSTEVAYATIATPEDLRDAPSSAGKPPYTTVVRIFDEQDRPGRRGRHGSHLRRQQPALRGLHRRRLQGHDRRPDVERRRRSLRRRRSPVRRGARRRDDRLRRGERLPQGGRGLPRAARRRWSRSPRSASRTPTSARGCEPSSSVRARASSEDELKEHVKTEPGPLQGAARDRLPRRAAAQRDRQDPQARAARPRDEEAVTGLRLGGLAPDFTLRDQFGQDVTLSQLPRRQGGGDPVLPVRLLRGLHRRDGRHPGPARRVHDLRHRGARHLVRPDLLAAGLRRQRRSQLPAAVRLLAARRGRPAPTRSSTTSRARRGARRTSSTGGSAALGGAQRERPRDATSTSTWRSCGHWSKPAARNFNRLRDFR